MSEDGHLGVPDWGDAIDPEIFEQILEMDDDDDNREFSREIVVNFFDQAQQTFKEMENCIQKKSLLEVSNLGHYLKGSSATLGLVKVRDACERIQNLGAMKDEAGNDSADSEEVNLDKISATLEQCKDDFEDAEARLRRFYKLEA